MTKEKKIDIFAYFIICFMSFIFVYFCSGSTSPIIERYYGDDSAVFQLVGKSWTQGLLPYVGTFDHKGPLIFLITAIGYAIGKYGLLMIQCVFMSFNFLGVYKLARFFMGYGLSCLVTIISYLILLATYGFGNYTEEYSLLFIVYAIYLGVKYLLHASEEYYEKGHPGKYAFWYGISFMAILCMRVTSALAICCVILVILVQLIKQKKWKNILENVVGFVGGCLIVAIPFCFYFFYHGALYEMLYGTIIHNILYTNESSIFFEGDQWRSVYIALYTDILLALISVLHILIKKKEQIQLPILGLLMSVLSVLMFIKMNRYVHYYMIILPYFALAVGMTVLLVREKRKSFFIQFVKCVAIVLVGIQLLLSITRISMRKHNTSVFQAYASEYAKCIDTMMNIIPEQEKEDILVFGSNACTQIYLVADIKPTFRYCMEQGWMSSCSEDIKVDVMDYLKGSPAKWLIVDADVNTEKIAENHCQEFADIIQDRYQLVDTEKMENDGLCFQLYELVE